MNNETINRARSVDIFCHADAEGQDAECSNLRTCYAHKQIAHAVASTRAEARREVVEQLRQAINDNWVPTEIPSSVQFLLAELDAIEKENS